LVPEDISEKGSLDIATFVYPPAVIESTSGELSGFEIAVARDIATLLGLDADFQMMTLDALIPALASNRHDLGVGMLGIIPIRTEVVQMVQDHRSSQSFLVAPDKEDWAPESSLDLCGLTVATTTGSSFVGDIETWTTACADAGEKPLTMIAFDDQAAVNLAIQGGRADFATSTTAQAVYITEQAEGKLARVLAAWAPALGTGIAVPETEHQDELSEALRQSIDHLIDSGRLQEILDEFNGGEGMIEQSEIFCCGETKQY
jgi:ABC-type amino acid transport substrate-binding protein